MRGHSPTPIEPRHRLSASANEDSSKRTPQRNKVLKDIEKALHVHAQERILSCKPTLKLVLFVLIFGTLATLFLSSAVYNTDQISSSVPQLTSPHTWMKKSADVDLPQLSSLDINWNEILDVIESLPDSKDYQGIGLLNFDDDEIDHWKELLPDYEHIILHFNNMTSNITWESLYPEWIDEDQESEVPTCPSLPKLEIAGKLQLELVAVKLPCNKSGSWSRDVARLHLQLETARLAASSKGYHQMHVLFVTDCFPIPNLFTCKDLVRHEGNIWLYEPNLNTLRDKLHLPVGSCELALPLKAEERVYSNKVRREAYATILHSADIYVCGAIVAAQSIRMAGSTRDLVILVDETITEYHREGLEAAGWKIHTIQRIRNPKAEPEAYNEWNYSKFRLWQLTDYDKIIFIDADMLILRNIDFLFEMPEISATGNNGSLFNSGVMVIEPSNCTFQLLMDHINEIESYNGGDQGYLNEVYTWWHRIPTHMNFLKHFWEGDEPEMKAMKTHLFEADPPILYVLHYLGNKPWLCFRDYDCNWNVDFMQEFASDVAHKKWWKVHDAMPRNLQNFCLLRTEQKAALEWDRRQAEQANYTDDHWKIKIKDKRLKTCFEDFCSWKHMLRHWGEKNWTDNASVTVTSASSS